MTVPRTSQKIFTRFSAFQSLKDSLLDCHIFKAFRQPDGVFKVEDADIAPWPELDPCLWSRRFPEASPWVNYKSLLSNTVQLHSTESIIPFFFPRWRFFPYDSWPMLPSRIFDLGLWNFVSLSCLTNMLFYCSKIGDIFVWSRLKACEMRAQCVSVSDEQPYSTTPNESKIMQRAPHNTLRTENCINELISPLFTRNWQ